MDIVVKGLASGYDIEHLARVFFPGAAVRTAGGTEGALVYARAGRRLAAGVRTAAGACTVRTAPPQAGAKLALSRLVYDVLCAHTGLRPPWGLLTGVRPLNLYRKHLRLGGAEEARRHMVRRCGVSEEKFALAAEIERRQRPLLARAHPRGYSLYISVPFCPSRCDYCSFVSRSVEREGHLMEPYLHALERELEATAAAAQENGLCLQSVYIGGGTPTALSAGQLRRLLQAVGRHFGAQHAAEYTVEAGRPDCTDAQKLALLKEYGVTRVSVNPQTMNDAVLRQIGRRHTAAGTARCFAEAREAGHGCINMDLISGLPGDDEASFARSLAQVLALSPENVTLHSLTRKRASNLVIDGRAAGASPRRMQEDAYAALRRAGYAPYYLYRQKGGVDNLENTGWARPGREGLYNIYIMEEAHTILAAGAGACTKLVLNGGNTIRRQFSHKFPADYIAHIDEILTRKSEVTKAYAGYLDSQETGGDRPGEHGGRKPDHLCVPLRD